VLKNLSFYNTSIQVRDATPQKLITEQRSAMRDGSANLSRKTALYSSATHQDLRAAKLSGEA
jgi:hypothetical protein